MHLGLRRFCFLIAAFSRLAWADYGWIPEYQGFQIRTGVDVSTTSNNFDNGGYSVTPTLPGLTGSRVSLQDTLLWIQPEYGVAQDWSAGFRVGFLTGNASSIGTGVALASGAALGDFYGSIKWRVSQLPLWTIEGVFKLPSGNAVVYTNTDIVTGEGNLDLGLKAHYGLHEGYFFLSVSPGLLARFGGYSSAATLEAAGQLFIHRAYGKFFVNSFFSFTPQGLAPSTVAAQTLAGTAGSYARLAASPTYVAAGAAFGVLISKRFRVEAGLTKTVWGQRTADSLLFTVNLLGLFDFSTPDLRPKVREVPFEAAGE